jgi:ankyrin repeat protein
VETESTSWLTAALLAGGNADGDVIRMWAGRRNTALCRASALGYEEGVRLLLQFGADPNKEGFNGWNALAVGAEYPGIVALLLENGADVNGTRADGRWNPLEGAAKFKNIESMRLMLQSGADPNRGKALTMSAGEGHEDAVRLLLEFGANPNSEDGHGPSALAESAKYPGIVALLLDKGADPNADGAGLYVNPLACAAKAMSVESLRLMLVHGGDATRVGEDGNVLRAALTGRGVLSRAADAWR